MLKRSCSGYISNLGNTNRQSVSSLRSANASVISVNGVKFALWVRCIQLFFWNQFSRRKKMINERLLKIIMPTWKVFPLNIIFWCKYPFGLGQHFLWIEWEKLLVFSEIHAYIQLITVINDAIYCFKKKNM